MQDTIVRAIGQTNMRSGVESAAIVRNDADDIAAVQL